MILVVDDKRENLISLKSVLASHGYPVHTAENGEEALKNVIRHNYGLIILDVQMPGMDGFEVAEMISGYSKTHDIPIIFLSAANTEKKFITKGYSSGAIDYITKPIDPDILLLKVNTFYQLYEQKRQLSEMQDTLRNEIEFRKKAQEDSQEKARQMISILESIPQIAFTMSPTGVIEYANSDWYQHTGNNSNHPLTHPDDPTLDEIIQSVSQSRKAVEREFRIRRNTEEEYRYFLLRMVPNWTDDTLTRWVGTFTDINEQKRASKRKDEFISLASHELKTPLTTIKGYVQLLQRNLDQNGTALEFVNRSMTQVNKLDRLVTDLLDISRMESGKLKLDKRPFDIFILLCNTVQLFRHNHPAYEFIQEGSEGAMVEADELRLEQVVVNFLSNAVKYSPDVKKVVVSLEHRPDDQLEVRIRDFGIGISRDDQAQLFKKFFRTPDSAARFHGLGLGLYICADILERHGAAYGVESEPGKGSSFYFRIPIFKNHLTEQSDYAEKK